MKFTERATTTAISKARFHAPVEVAVPSGPKIIQSANGNQGNAISARSQSGPRNQGEARGAGPAAAVASAVASMATTLAGAGFAAEGLAGDRGAGLGGRRLRGAGGLTG